MPESTNYSDEFIDWARKQQTSKRARAALEILLTRGSVTTGDLKAAGYDHPPRAVRDLKDSGFAIESQIVKVEGVRMSRYTLLDSVSEAFAQRLPIPNSFRKKLFEAHDFLCSVCGGTFPTRMLQVDHRVPFHIDGDPPSLETKHFMPLCGSDNRAKSRSCETCVNWELRNPETCKTCYWHDPEDYLHIATLDERRLTILAQGDDVYTIDHLKDAAQQAGAPVAFVALARLAESIRARREKP